MSIFDVLFRLFQRDNLEEQAARCGMDVETFLEVCAEMDARDEYYERTGELPPDPYYYDEEDPFGECDIEDIDPDDLSEEYYRTL